MEDVTNHKISDKSIVSSNHANNLECIFSFSFIMVHLSSRKTQGQISFNAYSHTALIISHQQCDIVSESSSGIRHGVLS